MTRVPSIYYFLLFVGLLIANVQVYGTIFSPAVLTVQVLGVGKGDAIFIKSPTGRTILVDAGPDARILRELGTALPEWKRSIDAIILTSTAQGSMRGLPDVLSRYQVKMLVRSEAKGPYSREAALTAALAAQPHTRIETKEEGSLSIGGGAVISLNLPAVTISYGATSLALQELSTTTATYISDGKTITRAK